MNDDFNQVEDDNKTKSATDTFDFDIPTLGQSKSDSESQKHEPEYIRNLKEKAKSRKEAIPIQLPIWVENRRGMPNTFLRSALFTCRRHNDTREHRYEMRLPSTTDFEITFTGLELSQDDEDVYMEIIHRSRFTPLGDTVTFSGYEVLKSLGWGTSSRDYKRLQNAIHRLKGGTIKIVHQAVKGYAGSLIRKYAFDELDESGKTRYKVWLEPELVSQFQEDNYTQLRYEQRKRLGNSGLSKWLHSYYSTHGNPNALKTETIRSLSGSDTKNLAKFRSQCKECHQRLVDVGFLTEYMYNSKADVFKAARA